MGVIKTGISAWTEPTLIQSGFYPKGARSAEARLRYYASRFPLVEVDATHYALIAERQAALWSERTPPGFTMNVKAFAPLSDHYVAFKQLPRDIRDTLSPSVCGKPRLYPKDLGGEILDELARRQRLSLRPLRASGRLGLVLFQFPVWFSFCRDNLRRLARLAETFPDDHVAVELRNRTFLSEEHRDATLGVLREHGLVYTCVDEPQGFASSVPPIAAATADIALLRMHGRNEATWEGDVPAARDRFAYLYGDEELAGWVPPLLRLADRAREVHVVMNNCYGNFAVRNAIDMQALVEAALARADEAAPRAA
jgi:uncharacterized protein YecE (DUF72 family)